MTANSPKEGESQGREAAGASAPIMSVPTAGGTIGQSVVGLSAKTQPGADPSTRSDGQLNFLWNVHSYTNEYIRFADAKAGLTAGTVLAVMGALVACHAFDSLSKARISEFPASAWLGALALALLGLSFICAILAIRPRLGSTVPKALIFWNGVAEYGSGEAYANQFAQLSAKELELQVSRHIFDLAVVCKRKYFWTNLAILTGAVGGLLAGAVVLAIHFYQHP